MLNEANQRATALLKKHDGQLHLLAKALLERETLTGAELRRMVNSPMKAGDVATLGDIERTRREKDEKEGRSGARKAREREGREGTPPGGNVSPAEAARGAAQAAAAAASAAKAAAGRAKAAASG